MAKLALSDSGKFSQSGTEFFLLKDDGDTTVIRFLYEANDGSDIDYYLVHSVELADKTKRKVACKALTEDGTLDVERCPLCMAKNKRVERLFLQVYDESDNKVKVWERGKNFVKKITTYVNKYGSLVTVPFEVTRNGRKGDTNTSYEFFPEPVEDVTLEDFPEKNELMGTMILDLTFEEMQDVVDGRFTTGNGNSNNESKPEPRQRQRRAASSDNEETSARRRRRGNEEDEGTNKKEETEAPAPQKRGRRTRSSSNSSNAF